MLKSHSSAEVNVSRPGGTIITQHHREHTILQLGERHTRQLGLAMVCPMHVPQHFLQIIGPTGLKRIPEKPAKFVHLHVVARAWQVKMQVPGKNENPAGKPRCWQF